MSDRERDDDDDSISPSPPYSPLMKWSIIQQIRGWSPASKHEPNTWDIIQQKMAPKEKNQAFHHHHHTHHDHEWTNCTEWRTEKETKERRRTGKMRMMMIGAILFSPLNGFRSFYLFYELHSEGLLISDHRRRDHEELRDEEIHDRAKRGERKEENVDDGNTSRTWVTGHVSQRVETYCVPSRLLQLDNQSRDSLSRDDGPRQRSSLAWIWW